MTFYTDVLGNRILQHITARTSASSADNAVVKNWPATSKFIYAATIGFNGKDTAASTYKVQWQDDAAPGFVDIAATGAIKWAATSDVLTNGTALTEANHRCSSQAADMTWENGEEIVAASLSDSINLSSDCYTEVQFALDPAGATVGHTYSLRLYSTAEGTVPGGGTFSGCLKILHTVTLTSPTVAVTAPAITFNLNKNISIDAQTISVACPAVTPNQDVYCINLVESTVSISAPNVGLKYKDPALWPPFFIQLKAAIVAKNVYIEVGAISITPPDIEYLRDYILDLAQSDISITAPDITCSKEYTATIDQSVSIDIVAPNISYIYDYYISIDPIDIVISAQDVSFKYDYQLTIDAESTVSASFVDIIYLAYGRIFSIDASSITIGFEDISGLYGHYILLAESQFEINASDITSFLYDHYIDIGASSIVLAFSDITCTYITLKIISLVEELIDIAFSDITSLLCDHIINIDQTDISISINDLDFLITIPIDESSVSIVYEDINYIRDYYIQIDENSISITLSDINFLIEFPIDTTSISIVYPDIGCTRTYTDFSIDTTSIEIVANDATLNQDIYVINLVEDSIILSSPNITLTYVTPNVGFRSPYFFFGIGVFGTLISVSSISITSQPISLECSKLIEIDANSISIGTEDIGLTKHDILSIESTSVSSATPDINYIYDHIIDISSQSITLVASDITYKRDYLISIDQSDISITTVPLDFIRSLKITLSETDINVSFSDINFLITLPISESSISIVFSDIVDYQYDHYISISAASITLTTNNLTLTKGNQYYVSYSLGDDAHPGTQAEPWKYCPGMTGWTGSYTLNPGDIVYFDNAETWSTTLTLYGTFLEVKPGVTYNGRSWGTGTNATISATSTGTAPNVISFYYDHATYESVLDGFKILPSGYTTGIGISYPYTKSTLTGAKKVIKNCILDGTGQTNNVAYGITVQPYGDLVSNVDILDNVVKNCWLNGIFPYAGADEDTVTNVLVSGNECDNNGRGTFGTGCGIKVKNNVVNCTVEYNYIHDNQGGAIGVSASDTIGPSNCIIRYNIIVNNDYKAGRDNSTIGVIADSDMSASISIYDNLMYNAALTSGLYFSTIPAGTVTVYFYNNTVYASGPCIYNSDSDNTDIHIYIKNNILYTASGNANLYDAYDITKTHSNNIYYRSSGNLVTINGTGVPTHYTAANLADWEATAYSTDPTFKNTSDLPTGFTSAVPPIPNTDGLSITGGNALGHGVDLGSPYNISINGLTRGTSWDIGAYQYILSLSIDANTFSIACPSLNFVRDYLIDIESSNISIVAPEILILCGTVIDLSSQSVTIVAPNIDCLRNSLIDIPAQSLSIAAPDITLSKGEIQAGYLSPITWLGLSSNPKTYQTSIQSTSVDISISDVDLHLLVCSIVSSSISIVTSDIELVREYTIEIQSASISIDAPNIGLAKTAKIISLSSSDISIVASDLDGLLYNRYIELAITSINIVNESISSIVDHYLGIDVTSLSITAPSISIYKGVNIINISESSVDISAVSIDLYSDLKLSIDTSLVTISTNAIDLSKPLNISAAIVNLTSNAIEFIQDHKLFVDSAEISIDLIDLTLAKSAHVINIVASDILISTFNINLNKTAYYLSIAATTIELTVFDLALSTIYETTLSAATVSIDAQSILFSIDRLLSLSESQISLNVPNILFEREYVCNIGSTGISISTNAITLRQTAYSISLISSDLLIVAPDLDISSTGMMSLNAGSISISVPNIGLRSDRIISLDQCSFQIGTESIIPIKSSEISLASIAINIDLQSLNLVKNLRTVITSQSISIESVAITFLQDQKIIIQTGTLQIVTNLIDFESTGQINLLPGSIAVETFEIQLICNREFSIGPSSIVITGYQIYPKWLGIKPTAIITSIVVDDIEMSRGGKNIMPVMSHRRKMEYS